MFELYRLRRKRRILSSRYSSDLSKLEKEPGAVHKIPGLWAPFKHELSDIEYRIESILSIRLLSKAERLDIECPSPEDKEMWSTLSLAPIILSPKGRSHIRKLIDEEKIRRRDVRAWWWKNIGIPAISAITGLTGVITGLVAVIHSKK